MSVATHLSRTMRCRGHRRVPARGPDRRGTKVTAAMISAGPPVSSFGRAATTRSWTRPARQESPDAVLARQPGGRRARPRSADADRQIPAANADLRSGLEKGSTESPWPGRAGLGVVGGADRSCAGGRALAMGMRVIVWNIPGEGAEARAAEIGAEFEPKLERMLPQLDAVSLHLAETNIPGASPVTVSSEISRLVGLPQHIQSRTGQRGGAPLGAR